MVTNTPMSTTRFCKRSETPGEFRSMTDSLIRFQYLDQGGANVIFKILPGGSTYPMHFFFDRSDEYRVGDRRRIDVVPHPDVLNKVLRVNKGLAKTLCCDEVVSGFYNDVRPLFVPGSITVIARGSSGNPIETTVSLPAVDLTKHLMEHEGVLLYPDVVADLISKCYTILPEENRSVSTSVPHRWGILLPDMSPTAGRSVTIEVKPKWLAQSPNAPVNAVRCRTCAMQVAKPKVTSQYLCPLRLVQEDNSNNAWSWIFDRVREQLLIAHLRVANGAQQNQEIVAEQPLLPAPRITKSIEAYLTKGDGKVLLLHLKFLQEHLDPQGVCARETMSPNSIFDHNLRLAMTLRDCSLYITAHYTSDSDQVVVDSKLGDLDFKSADKIDDWLLKEKALLDCAAYTKEVCGDLGCILSEGTGVAWRM